MTVQTFSRRELLNGLTASNADTFVAAILSASCWLNLDTDVTEMFKSCIYRYQELLSQFQ